LQSLIVVNRKYHDKNESLLPLVFCWWSGRKKIFRPQFQHTCSSY